MLPTEARKLLTRIWWRSAQVLIGEYSSIKSRLIRENVNDHKSPVSLPIHIRVFNLLLAELTYQNKKIHLYYLPFLVPDGDAKGQGKYGVDLLKYSVLSFRRVNLTVWYDMKFPSFQLNKKILYTAL